MKTRKNKFRANVKHFVDADYKDKLNKEDLKWYNAFEDEYYCNGVNKTDSIHKQELTQSRFNEIKKETYDATNAQNRCSYAISSTGSYLKYIESKDFYDELVEPLKKSLDIIDPQTAFNVVLTEVIDEIESDTSRELDIILTEMSIEMVKLGASISKQRSQKILKVRREKKEAKLLAKQERLNGNN